MCVTSPPAFIVATITSKRFFRPSAVAPSIAPARSRLVNNVRYFVIKTVEESEKYRFVANVRRNEDKLHRNRLQPSTD